MTNIVAVVAGLLPLYVVRFSISTIPTTLFETVVWAVAIGSFAIPKQRKQLLQAARAIPKQVLLWSGLFLLAAALSTVISPIHRSSFGVLKGWVITPMLFGFLIFASQYTQKLAHKRIIHALILSGLVVALLGLSQIQGLNRITSLYDVPNSLALFLVPITILSGWIGIHKKEKFYQYATIPMLIAIVYTQSAGALIALVGTMIIAIRAFSPSYEGESEGVYPERSRRARGFLGFFILLSIAILLFSGRFVYLLSPLTQPGTTNSVTVRLQLWDIGVSLIKQHPMFGIGLGQFEPAYQAELHRRFADTALQPTTLPVRQAGYNLQPEYVFRDPHNWIISFWLNMGLLGLISFVGLHYVALHRWFRISPPHMRGSRPLEAGGGGLLCESIYTYTLTLALISILIFGLVDTVYWKNDLSALWWMLISLLWVV